ncbi:DUF6266 family protein [Daejeonella lutea]|uniref:Uncharacterized protein n=1 Tax=Daejeonella lutea TaxID=572036 RepID=A0A1T5CXX9_9SPHI|nr:DUF6266 family protein [Daejeonella lutea]SKB64196.1 hypothetical protein SAMN05661099_2001 [Daejeonella lutea]
MKNTNTKGQTPLTRRDISFLKFLDNGTYSGTSTLQLPQRDRLRKIIDFFDIVFYLIDACYQLLKKRKNAGRAAIENLANALTGKFPDVSLDFSKVNILGGSLASPCATMHQNYGSSKLSFSWSRCTQCNSNESDELMAMIYCPERHEFWCEQNLGITRGDRFCTLDVPMEFDNKQVHVWLAYRTADGRENSNSSYMGEVLIRLEEDGEY